MSLDDFLLVEMLQFRKYAPELYNSFSSSPTINALWYSSIYGLYRKGLADGRLAQNKLKSLEEWNERNNGIIFKLQEGYISHNLYLQNTLKKLNISNYENLSRTPSE